MRPHGRHPFLTLHKPAMLGALVCAVVSIALGITVPSGLLVAVGGLVFVVGLGLSLLAAALGMKAGVSRAWRAATGCLALAYAGATAWLVVLLGRVPFG